MPELKLNPKYRPRVAAFTGWTILFFVLLRVAIGWHFLYEGIYKVKDGNFSATPYLLASQGPLKDVFRGMVFDADGFERMKPEYQVDRLNEAFDRVATHYELTEEQKKMLDGFRKDRIEYLKSLGMPKEEIEQIKKEGAEHVARVLASWGEGLGSFAGIAVKREDTLAIARARMEANRFNRLPVFDGEDLVGIIQASDLPASDEAGAADGKQKVVKDVMIADQMAARFARAKAAADYQTARESYRQLLEQVAREETDTDPKYNAQRLDYNEKKVNTARSALLARIEQPVTQLESLKTPAGPMVSLTAAQFEAGPVPPAHLNSFPGKQLGGLKLKDSLQLRFPPRTLTFWIDLSMMFGLIIIGACLILGLFTRLAAFGAVVFLAMFYLSMPPWPGVPEVPPLEGHYNIVNKNLIELLACVMIMSSRVGRWFGLDAFLGAIADRRRRRKAEREAVHTAQSPRDSVYIPGVTRPGGRETARV